MPAVDLLHATPTSHKSYIIYLFRWIWRGSLNRINKESLSERVYAGVREELISGRFKPGERVRIGIIAEELGISVTPVREAIFRLVSDKALEMKAATSVHVPIISPEGLIEIQRVRSLLEGEAAAEAAERITPPELAKLERIQREFQTVAATNPRRATMQNRLFHFGLIAAGRQPLIHTIVENMWVMMGPLLHLFHAEMPRRELSSDNHQHFQVLEGLRRRDARMTRAAIQADIAWGNQMAEWSRSKEGGAPVAKAKGAAPSGRKSTVVRPKALPAGTVVR